ncbi:hypothetical protein COZ55_01735 [archaeon CG_4_8_14_3_um_filter_38_5]|nr:MAG: hypothetical protein COZ55_01735 [archaeon CG_4_8_14_3_um_filter_38_5]
MKISTLLKYYNQDAILNEILRVCKDREVIPLFSKGFFGKRPSTILYKKDLLDLIRKGAVSFHISVERWRNPLSLGQTNTKQEMDELRTGWDLVFDVDTKYLGYAKICAKLLCHALEFHNINNYSVKYSGGTGFHLGVPFESFPETINSEDTAKLFPIAAQRIAVYLTDMIKEKLAENLLSIYSLESISEKTGREVKDLLDETGEFNPYSIIEIDTIAISPRHLIRMPYSVNEKKGRVSLPIAPDDIEDFSSDSAKIPDAEFTIPFLDGSKSRRGEARELFVQAFDWYNKKMQVLEDKKKNLEERERKGAGTFTKTFYKIPEEDYPPCIKKILLGLDDGKKRALFILINYFKSANYSFEEIEKIVNKWNEKNKEPLRGSYVKSQLSWTKKQMSNYLPPNCNSLMYYKDIQVCLPDEICPNIKNPLNYSYLHYKKDRHNRKK